MTDSEYTHILNFRRQVYIDPDNIEKVPSTFLITFENIPYRIFTSTAYSASFVNKKATQQKIAESKSKHTNRLDTFKHKFIDHRNPPNCRQRRYLLLPRQISQRKSQTNRQITYRATTKFFQYQKISVTNISRQQIRLCKLNNIDSIPPTNPHKKIAQTKQKNHHVPNLQYSIPLNQRKC